MAALLLCRRGVHTVFGRQSDPSMLSPCTQVGFPGFLGLLLSGEAPCACLFADA